MAKDMLDAICAAEAEAKNSELNARQTAAQMTAKARKDAADLIAESERQAMKNAEAELELTRSEGERAAAKAAKNAENECKKISIAADKNRPNVIKKAAEALLG